MVQKNNISIIGGGKVGCVLGKKLQQNGYKIQSVISRSFASAAFCGDFLDCENFSTSIEDISPDSKIFLITVPDSEIANVAKSLASIKTLKFNNSIVFHTSGVLTSRLLLPLKILRARTFSLHPFQTFISISSVLNRMDGIYYGIEGNKTNLKIARQIVNDLQGNYIEIPYNLKPIYHVAGVLSSNYLITLFQNIHFLFKKLQINPSEFNSILNPIINQTLRNLNNLSPTNALTGPIARGDYEGIELHLKSLAVDAPEILRLYISLGIETLESVKASGIISQQRFNQIFKLFIDYLKNDILKK